MRHLSFYIITVLIMCSCHETKKALNVDEALTYCHNQANKTLNEIGDTTLLPVHILKDASNWELAPIGSWVSGFWPGILWYDYENTKDESIKKHAIHYTELLKPLSENPANDHDLGFQIFCSYGNAYRLTGNEEYKDVIFRTADTLATLFNPEVGTILSWPWMVKKMDWPHNTIIDNMMNLEMLFWVAKNGGDKKFYDISVSHATVTMNNHFREDGSSYHVAVYDTINGEFIKGLTHQGYADNSMWARGQAWAIYGFTMTYRETKDIKFLRFSEKAADFYLSRLPDDYVPYWDFDAPNIPDAPRDASAAAIAASALLELSQLEDNKVKSADYKNAAIRMLESLSSEKYQSRESKPSFLLHSTGHLPANSQIDAAIIYADYYYIEALMRLKKMGQ